MELRFVVPSLRRLEQSASEVLVASWFSDRRPPSGVAGLVDYRLRAELSRQLLTGFATGAAGELLLVPGRPLLPFDKIILLGLGPRGTFGDRGYRAAVETVLDTLAGLRARAAVVELPGRQVDAVAPERAVRVLLELGESRLEHDLWTLVEPPDAQRIIRDTMRDVRRRS